MVDKKNDDDKKADAKDDEKDEKKAKKEKKLSTDERLDRIERYLGLAMNVDLDAWDAVPDSPGGIAGAGPELFDDKGNPIDQDAERAKKAEKAAKEEEKAAA